MIHTYQFTIENYHMKCESFAQVKGHLWLLQWLHLLRTMQENTLKGSMEVAYNSHYANLIIVNIYHLLFPPTIFQRLPNKVG